MQDNNIKSTLFNVITIYICANILNKRCEHERRKKRTHNDSIKETEDNEPIVHGLIYGLSALCSMHSLVLI